MRLNVWLSAATLTLLLGCEREQPKDEEAGWAKAALAKVQQDTAATVPERESPPPEASETLPVVSLDGGTHPHPVTRAGTGSRVYSRALRTWIYERPDRGSQRLGYLRAGGSAPTLGAPVPGNRCKGGFVPLEPRGFVCLDRRATLDADDPVYAAVAEHPPDFGRKLPYAYGIVRNPGPIYGALPDPAELRRIEPDVDERMPRWLEAGGEIGASFAQDVWVYGAELPDPRRAWEGETTQGVPWFLNGGETLAALPGTTRSGQTARIGTMMPRAGHAFLHTFLWHGRRYGITTRLEILPTDRLRPIRGSDFHGVEIGKHADFPFAFVRRVDARFHDGQRAAYREVLSLTGKQRFYDGVLHYETKDGQWISDRYASRLDPAKNMPGWGKNGEKWIDVNLSKQTLMLYEGTEPVFATLISSGEAGLEDAETTTATKRGIFRIHTKHVTATMSSREIGEEFELQDVPYVMYFDKEGYALHGAYWHDRFGTPKSHGCINLAPEDARRIFHWTEPRLPTGWHGVLLPLKGTVVFVHP